MLEIKNLHIQYGHHHVVNHVSLKARPGEFIVITGNSGTGKSSILSFIGCLEKFPCEKYQCFNEDVLSLQRERIEKLRRDVFGYVFQEKNLFTSLTVKENLDIYASFVGSVLKEEDIQSLLSLGELTTNQNQKVKDLSGGEKQRLALLCTLVKQPKVLLADEGTSHLDKQTEKTILSLLARITK